MSAPELPGSAPELPGRADPGLPGSADPGIASTIEALSAPGLVPRQRRGLIGRLVREAAVVAPRWYDPRAALRWVTEALDQITPYVPVRDLATLRYHHDGLDGDALADRLVRNAARATAGVGAASGGLAAVKWTVPPTLLAAPVLLGAETVAVVAIEIKLVGELHAAYRTPVPGDGPGHRAVALLQSWSQRRGLHPMLPGVGVAAVLGTAARKELRDRLARRFGTNVTTLAPMLTGAAAAAYLNRRATRTLGSQLRSDLARW